MTEAVKADGQSLPNILYAEAILNIARDVENFNSASQIASASDIPTDGVDVSLSETADRIILNKIVADAEGAGAGTAFMERLVAYADANRKQNALTPSADFGGSPARLREFYGRFDFVANKGRNKDFTTQEAMIREPALYQPGARHAVKQIKSALRAMFAGASSTKIKVGSASNWLRRAARRSGLDIDGFTHTVDVSAINHIKKRHGDAEAEKARGQIAITEDDVAAIPDILQSPDKVVFGLKTARGQDIIGYVKTFADGTTFFVEEARTGRHDLAAVSMRKYPAAIKSNDQIMARLDLNAQNDGGDAVKIVDVPKKSTAVDIQSEFQQEKRGSIQFPKGGLEEGQTLINLFESADLSTFLHETGHFFLEMFSTLADDSSAPQQIRDDMDVIRKFLGAEDGKPFSRDQHEKWARASEAYFMEGKAPSLELADAFARFKTWLTHIYRSVRGLNVKLNPEIREVFDRMLATDEEIAAARDAQALKPLFAEAPAGMSEGTWKIYQRMLRRSAEEASQKLLDKTMAKIRREKEAWWKTERAEVKKDVTAQINSRREFRLIEAMANKAWLGDEKREVPDMQLDRDQLVEVFGEGILPEINRTKVGGSRAV